MHSKGGLSQLQYAHMMSNRFLLVLCYKYEELDDDRVEFNRNRCDSKI